MGVLDASDELKEAYLNRMVDGLRVDGVLYPSRIVTPSSVKALQDLVFDENDIVLASFPKSGTTWMSEVLSAIAYEGDTEKVLLNTMDERVPWLEMDKTTWRAKIYYLWAIQLFGKQPPPARKRVIFTHLPAHLLPKSIIEGKCKLLYVSRNPKDNAVSYFHFHKMCKFLGAGRTDVPELTWNNYIKLFCSGAAWSGDWFNHVLGYWKLAQNNKNMKFLKFEELKMDLAGQIKGIEDFVGIPLSDENRAKVVKHCSFDSMKENKQTNRESLILFDPNAPVKFMRKGIVGDWKNYFTVAQNAEFMELYKKRMAGSGLDFDFE